MENRTFIIAEAGVNHNGSLELAKRLIDVASEAGVDCVKFQTFHAEDGVSKHAQKAEYQIRNTTRDESQLEMVKKLELPYSAFVTLKEYCRMKGIVFLSTPFDLDSVKFLADIGVRLFKVPSGEITNLPYLRKINSYRRDVILSTGMSTMCEVEAALKVLKDCRVTLMHCTTEYPCPYEAVNMRAMQTLKEKFGLPVGYSDHTIGIEVPIMAVAMGAEIIEKHITLNKNMEGPDHKASIEPDELKKMVQSIRTIEKAFGNGRKEPQEVEEKNRLIARKSIVAKCKIHKGDIFTEQNLATKRPGNGISPMLWDKVIGTAATRSYEEDELI